MVGLRIRVEFTTLILGDVEGVTQVIDTPNLLGSLVRWFAKIPIEGTAPSSLASYAVS
jgi:hypothetical protein